MAPNKPKRDLIGIWATFRFRRIFLILLSLILLIEILISLTIGRYNVHVSQVARILFENFFPHEKNWSPIHEMVVELVRLPRVLAAVLVGFGLAGSGAALQGLFRNPLVDPAIIGVKAGAGFGGTFAILLGYSGITSLVISFLFGMGSLLLVKFLATFKGRTSILALLLAGFIIASFFQAAISIVKLLADPHQKLPAIIYCLMGSLASTNYNDLFLLAISIVPCLFCLSLLRYQINIISLGEEKSRVLGVKFFLVQWMILITTSVISAGIVATSGIIGWVGLVIPHIARGIFGPNHNLLLLSSMILGGIYMLFIDNLARSVTTTEIPLGIITALIGVPVFAFLLRRVQVKGGWSDD